MPDNPNDKKGQKTQDHPGIARCPQQSGATGPQWGALASYFADIATPGELSATLERMQMALVYFCAMEGQDTENLIHDFTNVHEFKRALAQLDTTPKTDTNGD